MSKKRAAQKAPKKASKTPTKTKPAGPRSQVLPGMKSARSQRLDNLCEAIAEERARMNAAKVEEIGLIQSALRTMQERNLGVYRHGGVELARVPGAEKLRVRLTKETGDAGEADLQRPDEDDAEITLGAGGAVLDEDADV